MLKSTRSTLPSRFRSGAGGGFGRLYQYAMMEKSTRLTLPSPFRSFFTFVRGVGFGAATFFVPTENATAWLNELISDAAADFDFAWCEPESRSEVSRL